MTAFSDGYVLSDRYKAWRVVAAAQALASRFLAKGILTRGAIVHREAYHRGRILFGPAIIEAYQLERKAANYPRILVTESVRSAIWSYHAGSHWQKNLLKSDSDGRWFVNLLVPSRSSWKPLSNAPEPQIRAHLRRVRDGLILAIELAKGQSEHLLKVKWLVKQFNQVSKDERLQRIDM